MEQNLKSLLRNPRSPITALKEALQGLLEALGADLSSLSWA